MTKIKLPAAERRNLFRAIADEVLNLREDYMRRFRNALLCIVLSNPRWILWVEKTFPPRLDEIAQDLPIWLMLIEAAARWYVLKQYGFFHNKSIGSLLFRRDWSFTDRGTLSPG